MKTKQLLTIALLLCTAVLAGCKDKEPDPVPEITLSVSGATDSAIAFAATGNADVTLTVTTNAKEWDFTAPAWVTATKNGTTLVVNAVNNTGTARSGVIEFTAGEADPVEIAVSQAAPENDGGGEVEDDGSGIFIDGAFTDWASIAVTEVGVGTMKEAKYFIKDNNLYMYFKADKSALPGDWDNMQVFFDSDNNTSTGIPMAYALGENPLANGMDYGLELVVSNSGELVSPIGKWSGTVYVDLSTWASVSDVADISGEANITKCINGTGAITGDIYELEMKVILDVLPWDMAATFKMGARIGNKDADYFPLHVFGEDPDQGGSGGGDEGGGSTSGITIDGTFADWAEIPVTKVGVGTMKEAKYHTDGTDLYMYFKADKSVITAGWDNTMIFFDSDNDNTTGGQMGYRFGNNAEANGIDYALELVFANEGNVVNPIGKWSGSPYINMATWSGMTVDDNIKGDNIINCVNGVGAVGSEFYELEVKITVATLPWTLSTPFKIGAQVGAGDANYAPIYTWNLSGEDGGGDDGGGSTSGITIDGTFADWAATAVTATGPGTIKEAKYYTDGTDLFMYFKADKSVTEPSWAEFRIFFDSDNNTATGTPMGYALGGDNGNGIDNMLNPNIAGSSVVSNPIGANNGAAVYEEASGGWFSNIAGTEAISTTNITKCLNGIGAITGDYYELEIQVKMATLPWTLANTFGIAARAGDDAVNHMPVYTWTWK
jgi:hypothetical protein